MSRTDFYLLRAHDVQRGLLLLRRQERLLAHGRDGLAPRVFVLLPTAAATPVGLEQRHSGRGRAGRRVAARILHPAPQLHHFLIRQIEIPIGPRIQHPHHAVQESQQRIHRGARHAAGKPGRVDHEHGSGAEQKAGVELEAGAGGRERDGGRG